MLISLKSCEFMEMVKEVGIVAWGDRQKLRSKVDEIKLKLNENVTCNKALAYSDDEVLDDIGTEHETLAEEFESRHFETSTISGKLCDLCINSTQHRCRKCDKPVCQLFCSDPDPNSSNVMHRVHKAGDSRCIQQQFECPSCGETFETATGLQIHIENNHVQEASLRLLSFNSTSDWRYVTCRICSEQLNNEMEVGQSPN